MIFGMIFIYWLVLIFIIEMQFVAVRSSAIRPLLLNNVEIFRCAVFQNICVINTSLAFRYPPMNGPSKLDDRTKNKSESDESSKNRQNKRNNPSNKLNKTDYQKATRHGRTIFSFMIFYTLAIAVILCTLFWQRNI